MIFVSALAGMGTGALYQPYFSRLAIFGCWIPFVEKNYCGTIRKPTKTELIIEEIFKVLIYRANIDTNKNFQ